MFSRNQLEAEEPSPCFIIFNDSAKELLLGISSGYPYSIQLLGHESFNNMLKRYNDLPTNGLVITIQDFIEGLYTTLQNKEEYFNSIIDGLSQSEKDLLYSMTEKNTKTIPFTYDLEEIYNYNHNDVTITDQALTSLCDKKVLRKVVTKRSSIGYQYQDELFRIFIYDKIFSKQRELKQLELLSAKYENPALETHSRFFLLD